MSTQRENIIKKVLETLKNNPNGVRYTDLVRKIKNELPEVKENTIHGTIKIVRNKEMVENWESFKGFYS